MQQIVKVLLYISILVIIVAFMEMPDFYFDGLRIIVCATAVCAIINDYNDANKFWLVLFAFIAIVFNPLIPFHLHTKENWIALDIVCICVFVLKIYIYSGSSSFKTYLK